MANYQPTANSAYIKAMRELRRSSAASRHTDQHAQARKGHAARGGRGGAKQQLRRSDTY